MPLYSYTTADGETVERPFPMSQPRPAKIRLADGRWAHRDIAADHRQSVAFTPTTDACWPMMSRAMGTSEQGVEQDRKLLESHGIKAEHVKNKQGMYDLKLESREHRRKVLRAFGMHDKDGGYRD